MVHLHVIVMGRSGGFCGIFRSAKISVPKCGEFTTLLPLVGENCMGQGCHLANAKRILERKHSIFEKL